MVLPMVFGGGVQSSYSITNSARFNGTSAYLQKTLTTSSTTSGSVWVKRSKLGATSPIFDNKVYFTSGDALYAFDLTSTALYRDPSAWMHIFWNSTGVYVNGTLVTGTGSYTAASVTNPRLGYDGTNYFSGYMSDFAFWNGTSASLQGGATDSNGVWAAKLPSAGYSFLAFGSPSALGTDTSGNGNNWTVTGLAASDQMVDTPTNNYPAFSALTASTNTTWSNGGLTATAAVNSNQNPSICAIPIIQGMKVYFELKPTTQPTTTAVGFTQFQSGSFAPSQLTATSNVLNDASTIQMTAGNGTVYKAGSSVQTIASYSSTDTVGVAVDYSGSSPTIQYYKGGATNGTAITGVSSTSPLFIHVDLWDNSVASVNFGQSAFAYTPPTGFKPLCTANLPSVAVTTSGTFTGNANADGPFVWTNGNPATLTINGNAVTFGTHADKTAGGFKLRSSSASYNTSGSNTWTATAGKRFVYSATSINNAQGNP